MANARIPKAAAGTATARHGPPLRPVLRAIGCRSVGFLFVNRLDRTVPGAVVLAEQFLSRRDAARNDLLQRPQVAGLVASVVIETLAADQALFGKRQRL